MKIYDDEHFSNKNMDIILIVLQEKSDILKFWAKFVGFSFLFVIAIWRKNGGNEDNFVAHTADEGRFHLCFTQKKYL